MNCSVLKPKYHCMELNKAVWEVPDRYHTLVPIGIGAYGQVVSAHDRQANTKVAIKKLSRPFQTSVHAKRTYRELRMLKHMNHENVINLLDCFTPSTTLENFSNVYMVTPLMGADLNNIFKTQRLSDDHIQFLTYQILRALKYIHSAGIVHRILDFGLARHAEDEMTGYVATRWYRAPEIMLNWMKYNNTVDIWSVGCIMAEMINGKPLFPGTDHIDQLTQILRIVGSPNDDLYEKISSEDAKKFIRTMPVMKKCDFRDIFPTATREAIQLLERMLDLDTDCRISAAEALAHPYLRQYADPQDEPTAQPYDQSFEIYELSLIAWKELVYKEVVNFAPPPPPPPSVM